MTPVGQPWAIGTFDAVMANDDVTESSAPKLWLKGFSRSGHAEGQTGIYLMEKFDPTRTPVLFVHGLMSDPITWKPMVETLRADSEIASRFQFWFYAYPSGTPVVPSAAMLKRHLDAAVAKVEDEAGISMHRRLVVIGHSMGGMLSKSLVSRTGDRLWDSAFRAPLEEFDLEPSQRKMLGAAFRYEPRTYVSEVVFIAAPHRGSDIANAIAGKIGSRLSARPKEIERLAEALVTKNGERLNPEFEIFVRNKVNSISTLRPDSPVTRILADLPVDRSVSFHTLAGIKKLSKPTEGDGVVPLASTHVDGALCEAGIQSGHAVHNTPQAAALVGAILKRRAGLLNDTEIAEMMSVMDLAFARFQGKNPN